MLDDDLDSFVNSRHKATASAARLLTAITFHFAQNRLDYLEKVLRSLASFPVARRDVVVFTNTTNAAEQKEIHGVFHAAGLLNGQDARLEAVQGLSHPFELTWAHKKLISETFLSPGSPYSHFAYIEDDEELTFENFTYFLRGREILRPFGLIPALLRVEWNAKRNLAVNVDNIAPIDLAIRPAIANQAYAFVEADNPYSGGFILDAELAREYVVSRSFDSGRSREVSSMNIRERAAMGLTFENPPPPFVYRTVIPVSITARAAPSCTWLAHLPNNYQSNPEIPFGKMAMADLFTGDLNGPAKMQPPIPQDSGYRLCRVRRWDGKNALKRLRRSSALKQQKLKTMLKLIARPNR